MNLNQKELKRIQFFTTDHKAGLCWVSGPIGCGKSVHVDAALRDYPWKIISMDEAVRQCERRAYDKVWMGEAEAERCIVLERDPLMDRRTSFHRVRGSVAVKISMAARVFKVIVETQAKSYFLGPDVLVEFDEEQVEDGKESNRRGAEGAEVQTQPKSEP